MRWFICVTMLLVVSNLACAQRRSPGVKNYVDPWQSAVNAAVSHAIYERIGPRYVEVWVQRIYYDYHARAWTTVWLRYYVQVN